MAHGRALQYVGDHTRAIPGVPRMDLLPEAEDTLPVDPYTGQRWTFAHLVATGDYAWAPVAQVAESETMSPVAPAAPLDPDPTPRRRRG